MRIIIKAGVLAVLLGAGVARAAVDFMVGVVMAEVCCVNSVPLFSRRK